ncbi:MAG: hypothetical protein ACM3UO_00170 [Bacillota bacterium]
MTTALVGTLRLSRAVVSLAQSDLTNPSNIVVGGTSGSVGGGGQRVDAQTKEGSFRQYANGVTRLILGSGSTRTQTFAMRALTPAQVSTLEGMIGLTVCFRDTYGRKVYGAFLTMNITDIPLSGDNEDNSLLSDVGLVIQSVTYDETAG